MRLLRNMIVGIAFLSLTSCSESPQQAPESTRVSQHAVQPNGQSAVHSQPNAHSQHANQHTKAISVGDTVPDFEVMLDGRTWRLSELRKNKDITLDGTLILTFWCSFCESCRHVERDLDKLAKQYHGKVGVIALDASFGETRQEVAAFAKERGLTFPIALNASGSVADIFGVKSTTTTAVIDSTGILRYLGQFSNRQQEFAHDALKAVLAGKEIAIKRTRPKG